MERVSSADGTTIAFERHGDGPAVLLVPGATCTRGVLDPLAAALAEAGVPAVTIDRRGRGDSDDRRPGPPWDVDREVEDLRAVAGAVDVTAVYGHSSGAAVALHAVAAGVGPALVMHDAPYALQPGPEQPAWDARVAELVGAGRPGDAITEFWAMVGMPPPMIEGMRQSPQWPAFEAIGPTLGYDSAAMGNRDGGGVPVDLLAGVTVPTLVLAGGADHPFMRDVAQQLAEALPDGRLALIDAGHDASPDLVVPSLLPFLTGVGGRA